MDITLSAPPTATAPGLLLRLWADEDVRAILAAHRDPLMRRFLRRRYTTAEQVRQAVQERRAASRAGTAFSFVVLEPAGGSAGPLVGHVNLRGVGDGADTGEVGYWVVPSARGRGVAPRALLAVCEWALGSPRFPALERLRLVHAVDNEASCRGAQKAGFALSEVIPPLPPDFPYDAHLHVRPRVGSQPGG